LIEAHGLNFLAKVAQLELAKKEAVKRGIVVTPEDVAAETDRYLNGLFNEERDPVLRQMNNELEKATASGDTAKVQQLKQDLHRERFRLLDQLLQQQKLTRPDFDLVMQTNTYLRKIATSIVTKDKITDENLLTAFNMLYGEKVQVRHIALANRQEAMEAQRRLAGGEPFEQVARAMSRNQQSGALGGELPPLTRNNEAYPQQFRDVAFGLTEGQVSDVVVAANGYHLIKLEKRIAPKVVKFEDVKESVRDELYGRQLDATIRELSNVLKRTSAVALKINEPELKRQFDQQVNKREEEVKDRDEVRRDLERRRPRTGPETRETAPSAAEPTTVPTDGASTRPATPEAATTAPSH
jgi:parvulin-like peptidyl-prolyl isomerase